MTRPDEVTRCPKCGIGYGWHRTGCQEAAATVEVPAIQAVLRSHGRADTLPFRVPGTSRSALTKCRVYADEELDDVARAIAALSTPTEGGELPVAWTKRSELEKLSATPPGYARAIWPAQTNFISGEPADVPLYARPTPAAAAGVPPGMVLVPREPTKAMLEAAVKSRHGPATYKVSVASVEEQEAAEDYRAMLAASGAPQSVDDVTPTAGGQQ